MPLTPGLRLGPYEITAQIGAGGMGEVYRATDTNLARKVAIKVLPEAMASDPDRLARFDREARTLATLNHPHIAQIYGIERLERRDGQDGHDRFTPALVMELVEGPTLAEKLEGLRAEGLGLDETLAIAAQIAAALEAAHDKGIVHRDLKPANVKIAPDGTVKVLDFGLAKMLESDASSSALSMSPTISIQATHAGVILGTAAYMSPEQARGKVIDRRTDIWSFGCVLFEMLAGKRPFEGGDTVSDAVAAILKTDPDWTLLPAGTPPSIQKLLRRCLQKDPQARLPHIGIVRFEIDEARAGETAATAQSRATAARWSVAPWLVAAAALVAAGIVLVLWAPWRPDNPSAPVRLSVEVGADASLFFDQGPAAVLSPDGETIAFSARTNINAEPTLLVRRLNALRATALAGTEGARNPFFSPGGDWIAFFAGGKLKKVATGGGAVVTLCDAPSSRGGDWSTDGTIVFTPNSAPGVTLFRVSSSGGAAVPLTTLGKGETTHRWPQIIAGGQAVLYTSASSQNAWDTANILVQPLPAGPAKVLLRNAYFGRYAPSGHLLYIHEGTLFAAPFDIGRMEIAGNAVPVVESVASSAGATGGAQVSLSATGTLVYLPAQQVLLEAPIVWLSRDGKTAPLRATPANWANPVLSPDGRQLGMYINAGAQSDVWTYDLARDTLTRLTFDPADDSILVWTPDGRRIAWASNRPDRTSSNLYWQRADGTGDVQRLTESGNNQFPGSWHPGGKYLAFHEVNSTTRGDLMILPVEGDEATGWKPGKPTAFLRTPFNEMFPSFSPDGRWIAYSSNESGREELYVRPFPGPGGKWQISSNGGSLARWSRARNELVFQSLDNHLMVVAYKVEGDAFLADKPQLWSPRPFLARTLGWDFELDPKGDRVALALEPETKSETKLDHVTVVFNFLDEVRRLTRR